MSHDDEIQREEEIEVGGGLWIGCLLLASGVFWVCVTIAVIYSVS